MSTKPFLKWVGGKRKLLPELTSRIGSLDWCYFEPFLGGGALFFELRPQRAYLSDVNKRLVRCYRAVRDDVSTVVELLREHAAKHSRDYFYEVRSREVDSLSDCEVGAWMVYLNKTCFNGLYRVNKAGTFNVPLGDYKNPTICDESGLRACSVALQGCVIRHGDFESSCADATSGDLVYFDPPYIPLNATSFVSYDSGGFEGHQRLRDCALRLKQRGVRVLVSNSWTPLTLELYGDSDFSISEVRAPRSVNSRGTGRGLVSEALIS